MGKGGGSRGQGRRLGRARAAARAGKGGGSGEPAARGCHSYALHDRQDPTICRLTPTVTLPIAFMDPTSYLPLAPRDLLVLAVLSEGPLHGYGIIKAVEARSEAGVLLDPANLYRLLRRMRERGWLEDAENDADRRRVHRITADGRAVLGAELDRLQRLLGNLRPAPADG